MEGSEPTLVPEWLRCTGRVNQNGGGSSTHHFASFSSQSDVLSSINSLRNRSSRSISDKDSSRFAFLDRSTSSNSRHSSSSNGSAKHPYSSFSRSHRDKNREKEKERSTMKDLWDHDCSDPLGSILSSRVENITLRRSQSLVSRKPGDAIPRRTVEMKNSGNFNKPIANGMHKAAFEKDFPSLGAEEKQGVPEIGRVPSPGLSSAVHSLPIGNSGLICGEGWTSALAEVPAIMGTPSLGHSSVQQSAIATPLSVVSSASSVGLNMAEALSQAPSRARTTPQVPDKTQRLEELAIKQSRQLIPLTLSTPKPLVLSSSDKLKQPKTAIRTTETTAASKSGPHHQQQQSPNQSLRAAGPIRNDSPKASSSHVGKFHVLKPLWENNNNNNNDNGPTSTSKDPPGPTPNPQPVVAALAPTTAPLAVGPHYPKVSPLEKKHSLSQAQSRSDFFNLMRKKSSVNSSPATNLENSSGGMIIKEAVSALASPRVTENGGLKTAENAGGSTCSSGEEEEDVGHKKNACVNGAVYPDEEEAAFLRSLGWEENGGEDEGLTEEEINAFLQEYKKLKPSLKVCRGVQLKFEMLCDSCPSSSAIASSEVSFSGSKAEA